MIKEIQHKRRAMLTLVFIIIPSFLLSLWTVIQLECYDYIPSSKKAYVSYFGLGFMPMLGFLCYLVYKKELKMKLTLHQASINFGEPFGLTKIPIEQVEFAELDAERGVVMFNMISRIPLENHNIIELNLSNYEISFDSFISLMQQHYSQMDIR